jgi:membrane protein
VSLKSLFNLLKTAAIQFNEDKASRLGAALAYYSIFSLAPLLLVIIVFAGIFLGDQAGARTAVIHNLAAVIGVDAARQVGEMAVSAHKQSSGLLASIIGIVILLMGASGVFMQLQDALNTIWKVEPKPGQGIGAIIQQRFLSLSMVLGAGFLLLLSLFLTTTFKTIVNSMSDYFPMAGALQIITFVVSFFIITLLFVMIYRALPDVDIHWRDVWIGAVITAILFLIGQAALSWYLGTQSTQSVYGAAGSLVVLLLYVYYSAQIVLFGAEFTYVYANCYGSKIEPSANAISTEQAARDIPMQTDSEKPRENKTKDETTPDVMYILLGIALVALLRKWRER